MRIAMLAAVLLGLLGGCTGGSRLNIACPPLEKLKHDVPFSRLEREIHGLGPQLAQAADGDLARRLDTALASRRGDSAPGEALLMLSGGGQWGAFGAGFLDELRLRGTLPQARVVTGISTGALQSLFVSIGTPEAYAALLQAYAPKSESEIVDRGGMLRVLFKGSMAGLDPLRRRIEAALCPEDIIDDPARPCALDALKAMRLPDGTQSRYVLIGFTAAATGKFEYVDAVDLAQLPRRMARTCITGAALASAAMPVNFEQVQINGVTYYDGGTRASVFEAKIAAAAREAAVRYRLGARPPGAPPAEAPAHETLFPIHVVRNGPTTVVAAPEVDEDAGPLTAAQRAEAILVNQLEVTSIAMIRIEHPTGTLRLATADGYAEAGCDKPGGGVMFSPIFMECLTRLGRRKARSDPAWIELSNLGLRSER